MASPLGQGQLQQFTSQAQGQGTGQVPMSFKQCVRQWYPDLLQHPHFLPHVYMHRVKHNTVQVAGVDVSVPQSPVKVPPARQEVSPPLMETDVRVDRAQQHFLFCLRQMAEKQREVMFVLSQLGFGDYLAHPSYTAATMQLPKPRDLASQKHEQGEFDVLIIDRQYGLLAGEINSVGISAPERGLSQQQLEDEVLQTLRKMMGMTTSKPVSQLAKARDVLQHIVSDLQPVRPRVGVTLILPYVSSHLLRTALARDPPLQQALCGDLGLELTADPVPHCLCSDQLSDRNKPYDVTDDVLTNLGSWWSQCMSGAGPDPAMTDNLYEDLVARFAGPATMVRIFCAREPRLQVTDMRTAGQFVSEVGDRLSAVALYQYQVDLIHAAPDLAYLMGPPGTGKTLTAVVMALEWLRQNLPVHILSGDFTSRAAAHLIKQQLEVMARQTLGPQAASQVHIHLVDWQYKDRAMLVAVVDLVKTLTATATNGQVCIIADEVSGIRDGLDVLYEQLTCPLARFRVRLWAASLYSVEAPRCLEGYKHRMTVPLRCPPCVVREVEQSNDITSQRVLGYTAPPAPMPCDGPPVLYVCHQVPGHEDTQDCEKCGLEVGLVLRKVLHVGQGGNTSNSSSSSAPALQYRDVFVLSSYGLHDDETDATGHVTSPANGVVRGLRQAEVPVRVVRQGDGGGVADVATMCGPDSVTATRCDNVKGLERKVVVWMGAAQGEYDGWGRLLAMSRATAQLIWVKREPPQSLY